jgi:DNA repair exonuclease SbcCD nuclease subunit
MRLLYFSDPHLSAVGPISRIDNYAESIFRKLNEIRELAVKESIDKILCGGDFFHLKSWVRNPYSLTNKFIDCVKSMPCGVIGIYGDHDVPFREEGGLEGQPLGSICRSGNLELLSKTSVYSNWNKFIMTGAPKTDSYEADLTNYMPSIEEHLDRSLKKGDTFRGVHVHLSHGDLWVRPPQYEPHTLYSQLAGSTVDYHFNGHVHDDLGEVKVGKTTIINRGALSRGSLTESNLNRKVMVTILDTIKKTLQYIELKSALPAAKIFDLERVKEIKQAESEIMRLGELIKFESGNVELSGPESIRHLVRELKTIKEPVREQIFQLLDRAEQYQ